MRRRLDSILEWWTVRSHAAPGVASVDVSWPVVVSSWCRRDSVVGKYEPTKAADAQHNGFDHRWNADCGWRRPWVAVESGWVAAVRDWAAPFVVGSCSSGALSSWLAVVLGCGAGTQAVLDRAQDGSWPAADVGAAWWRVAAAAAADAGGGDSSAPMLVLCRYRLVIFSKNHSIPMSCTVC